MKILDFLSLADLNSPLDEQGPRKQQIFSLENSIEMNRND